jgi:predicted Zn finger-like uncharacterized protein
VNTQKTRCPYCSSVFAVSTAQLAIRDGYTRCGKCFQVFKADDYLIQVRGTEPSNDKSPPENQIKNHSHIVDLYKISPTKSTGFNAALDSFLDKTTEQSQPSAEQSSIDYDYKQKETISLSVIPNAHPSPDLRTPELLSALAPAADRTPDSPQSLGQEFNEQWLSETTPETNDTRIQSINKTLTASTQDNTAREIPAPTAPPAATIESKAVEKNAQSVDDDLMGYLNKNSVAAASVTKVKTERILPGMNDFHANQRSKKKHKTLPMHFNAPKRNVALDKLTERKSFFNINLLYTLGWFIVSLLMLALLAAQYIFFNFDQLAANPRYQPMLHKACSQLGCDVPLVDISKIKINKIIAQHYPANPTGATKFTASMTNLADEGQPFPTIRLIVLKNKQVLSGRIVLPNT